MKLLLNDFILTLDGFKNHEIFYSDTDSICIHNDDYEILKTNGFIGEDLCHSKND